MKKLITLLALFSPFAFGQSDVFLRSRGLDTDLQICVNDGGVEACPIVIDGATGNVGIADPSFSGTVSGLTSGDVSLGNVTNESKATMFTNPTFTGTANIPVPAAETSSCPSGGTVCSGTYNPSDVGGSCSPGTLNLLDGTWHWVRVGNIVNVAGIADLLCASSGGTFLLSLPINSDLINNGDLVGYASSEFLGNAYNVRAHTGSDRIQLTLGSFDTKYNVQFQYRIQP